jgi:putative ABC transport system permease protein
MSDVLPESPGVPVASIPVGAHHAQPAQPILGRPGFVARLRIMGGLGITLMFHDRLKLAGTLFGVVFAVLLGNFQAGTFLALAYKNVMLVDASKSVDIWITPPGTQQIVGGKPLTDAQLNRARSTPGVAWAEPLLLQTASVQLPNGGSEAVSLIGTRSPRFAGGPWNLVAGSADALLQPGAVIFEDSQREKLGGINLGSVRELSGVKVQAVGFSWGLCPFAPCFAFAEESQARTVLKLPEGKHTFITVGLTPGADPDTMEKLLQEQIPDTRVMTRRRYLDEIIHYLLTGTQIGVSFGMSTFMGLLVGLITVALSMFSSVIDNLRQFGTLKAMGCTNTDLALLLVFQAVVYGVVGSIIGLGMVAGMVQGMRNPQLTPVVPNVALGITVGIMVFTCLLASVLALLRLRKLEPAMVFR